MTPYELEMIERRCREQIIAVVDLHPSYATMLRIIFEMQATIIRHLADVEAEANLLRNQQERE